MDQIIKHGIQLAASLDPASQKEMRATLTKIFSEAGIKINFDTPENRTNIQNLAKAFQTIFAKAGNTSIDFSKIMKMPSDQMFKELGTIAATQFWDAWNAVANSAGGGGVVSGVKQQLDALTKQRNKLMSDYEKASKMYDRYDNAMGVRYMESDEFTPLHKQKDIDKQAYSVMDNYDNSLEQLSQLEKGAKGYNAALLQAFESYEKLFKMKATLDLHDGPISDDVMSMYSDKQLKGLTDPFLQKYGGDMDKIGSKALVHYQSQIDQISKALSDVDGKISTIQQKSVETAGQSGADSTLLKLKQIKEAYNRILNKSGTINKPKSGKIQSALDYTPGSESLDTLSKGYNKSFSSSENWEVQYQWLTKFVREYEAYANSPNADQKKLEQYKALYQQLQPMAEDARNMLQNVLNTANNMSLVGVGGDASGGGSGTGTGDGSAGASAEEVENARKLAEEEAKADKESSVAIAKEKADTEATANAEEKVAAAAKITKATNEESAAAAEKERLAQEGSAKAALEKANARRLELTGQLSSVGAESTEISTLEANLAKRKEIFSLLQQEDLLTDEIRVSYDAVNNEITEKIALLKKANTNNSGSGTGIGGTGTGSTGTSTDGDKGSGTGTKNVVTDGGADVAAETARLTELQNVLVAVTTAVTAKTQAFTTEGAEVQRVVTSEVASLDLLEKKILNIKSTFEGLLTNIKAGNNIDAGLSNIAVNVNYQAESTDTEQKQTSWALESTLQTVKGVLDNIQTNTAKTGTTENTSAVANVNNVLATESTLAAIKGAVDAINTKITQGANTGSSGSTQSSPNNDVGLARISETNENSGFANTDSTQNDTASMKLLADISLQKKNLEKFVTQLQAAGKLTDEYQVWINNLTAFLNNITSTDDMGIWKKAFQYTKTSVGIDDITDKAADKENTAAYKELIELQKTRNDLELKHAKAKEGSPAKQFYAEELQRIDQTIAKQRILIQNDEQELKLAKMKTAQERKLGEAEAQAETKNAKKNADDAKRDAKKSAMFGKASNAVNRAEGVWMNAQSIEEPLSSKTTAQVDQLYNKLVALRELQNDINKAESVTPEQQDDLRKQTMEVNKLTNEVSELITEYQKLSGSNATEIGTNTLGSSASPDAYQQQLRQAVLQQYPDAQIKKYDAATRTLSYTLKTGKHEFTEYTAAVRRADNQLVAVQGTTKKTETFFELTKRKMKELSSYMSGMMIFSYVRQIISQGIQYVRDIDSALTDLKKVTDETEESYERFLDTAAKTADKIGSTIQEIVSSTADWARLNI